MPSPKTQRATFMALQLQASSAAQPVQTRGSQSRATHRSRAISGPSGPMLPRGPFQGMSVAPWLRLHLWAEQPVAGGPEHHQTERGARPSGFLLC